MTFDSVTPGAIDEVVTGEFPAVRGGVGVPVIGHDHYQGQLFHRCHVDSLVKRSRRSASISDCCSADGSSVPPEASSDQCAGHDGNERPQMTDHWELSLTRSSPMHIAVPSQSWPCS